MSRSALSGLSPPGPPSFGPVPDHPSLLSDTPLLAQMLLSDWRSIAAPFLAERVAIQPNTTPITGSIPVLLDSPRALDPSAVIDPARPAWVQMRADWMARKEGDDE